MENVQFFNQWQNRPSTPRLTTTQPTKTIPDQSMTIQEIIKKFTRTGLVPQSYTKKDQGGNEAFHPDFDPMDEYSTVMSELSVARTGSSSEGSAPHEGEPPRGEGEGKKEGGVGDQPSFK